MDSFGANHMDSLLNYWRTIYWRSLKKSIARQCLSPIPSGDSGEISFIRPEFWRITAAACHL